MATHLSHKEWTAGDQQVQVFVRQSSWCWRQFRLPRPVLNRSRNFRLFRGGMTDTTRSLTQLPNTPTEREKACRVQAVQGPSATSHHGPFRLKELGPLFIESPSLPPRSLRAWKGVRVRRASWEMQSVASMASNRAPCAGFHHLGACMGCRTWVLQLRS